MNEGLAIESIHSYGNWAHSILRTVLSFFLFCVSSLRSPWWCFRISHSHMRIWQMDLFAVVRVEMWQHHQITWVTCVKRSSIARTSDKRWSAVERMAWTFSTHSQWCLCARHLTAHFGQIGVEHFISAYASSRLYCNRTTILMLMLFVCFDINAPCQGRTISSVRHHAPHHRNDGQFMPCPWINRYCTIR